MLQSHSPALRTGLGRRGFLGLAGAGLAAAAAGGLAGCTGGSQAPTAPNANGYQPGSAALEVQLGPEIEGVLYPEPWNAPRARTLEPFGDPAAEIRVLTRQQTGIAMDTNRFTQWLEEQTGVRARYEVVAQGDEGAPKVNAMIASGDVPDVFMLGPEWMGGFTRSQMYVYGQQGLFQPLDELIDKFAPELRAIFERDPQLREYLTTPDGAIYAFPAINDCFHCRASDSRMFVNKAWLDQLGLAFPTTTDELRTTMEAIVSENPGGAPGTFAYSGTIDWPVLPYFLQSFTYAPASWLAWSGSDLVFTPTDDGFRDGLRYVAGLVRDGLMDPTSFTQTGDQLLRKGNNPAGSLFGMSGNNTPSFIDTDWDDPESRHWQWTFLPPVAGPGGQCNVPWLYNPAANNNIAISVNAANPEMIVRWCDAQLGLEATLRSNYGRPDVSWRWGTEGEVAIDGRQSVYGILSATEEESANQGWGQWNSYGLALDTRNGQNAGEDAKSYEPMIYNAAAEYQKFAVDQERFFMQPYLNTDEAAQVGELQSNIETHYLQGTSGFATGQLDIEDDAAWAAYVSRYDQLGVQQYVEVNQAASQR